MDARLIDANLNRAREGLRVMEDTARFLHDDRELAARFKLIRHAVREACACFGDVIAARDSAGDVGTTTTAAGETKRADLSAVIRAAGGRTGEAIRTLEEFAKIHDPSAAARLEQTRYAFYDAERDLVLQIGFHDRPQWRLCVLLTAAMCAGAGVNAEAAWEQTASAIIRGGADCIQVREKDVEGRVLLDRVRRLRAMVAGHSSHVSIVVNDRPDIALMAGADGVHLGQDDVPARECRRLSGDRLVIGVSTSCIADARQAFHDGADLCGIGPMFPTSTKQKDIIVGPGYLDEYLDWNQLPHLAIGGIDIERAETLAARGARGIAVSSAILRADDPEAATRACVLACQRGQAAYDAGATQADRAAPVQR